MQLEQFCWKNCESEAINIEGAEGSGEMINDMKYQHFILTRFNLKLWPHDKSGNLNGTIEWLEHRCSIFEKFCLPSVAGQTLKDFEWILLLNSETPAEYKDRIESYKNICPQICTVYVKPEHNRRFAAVFKQIVQRKASADRIITTYLDNDDCLRKDFVEDIQNRLNVLPDGTFLYYKLGFQYYEEFGMMLKIIYQRNHFPSVIESRETFKTVYGYAGHYYVDRLPNVRIELVEDSPMWCEIVHKKNELNDAYFLFGIRQVRDKFLMRKLFSVDLELDEHYIRTFVCYFIPRYIKTFFKRAKKKIFGKDMWK